MEEASGPAEPLFWWWCRETHRLKLGYAVCPVPTDTVGGNAVHTAFVMHKLSGQVDIHQGGTEVRAAWHGDPEDTGCRQKGEQEQEAYSGSTLGIIRVVWLVRVIEMSRGQEVSPGRKPELPSR